MVKFFMKCFLVTTILLFGVLLGIYQANHGMMEMKGNYVESAIETVKSDVDKQTQNLNFSKNEEKRVDGAGTAVQKEVITSHDLQEKQRKLEEIQAFNFFSQLGVQISELMNTAVSSFFNQVTRTIDKGLSSLG